jgi:hypothetical protein
VLGRGFVCALLAVVLASVGDAGAASTRLDGSGTVLIDGSPAFPIVLAKGPPLGVLSPSGRDPLDEVASAGVTFLKIGPATTPWTEADIEDAKAWNRAAAARGLYTWVNLSTLSRATAGSATDALLERVVTTLTGDAAGRAGLGMWKGADEPRWSGFSAASLQFAYCRATGRGNLEWCAGEPVLDREHAWVTIQAPRGTAAELAPYASVTDVHGVDIYPVTARNPTPDLHQVGAWTTTLANVTPSHAVWTTLQVCASGSADADGAYVLPTRAQERYMIYDAIINGARSLAFYGGNIPTCWNASDRAHAPALVNTATTRILPTSDATTQAIARSGAAGDTWVLAARSGPGTERVTIAGLPATVADGSVYTEGRSVTASGGSFSDSFAQWDVHVYRFPAAAGPSAPPPTRAAPDLKVTIAAKAPRTSLGDTNDVTVTAVNAGGDASGVAMTIDVPAALALVGPPAFDRGSGCTGTGPVTCALDYLPGGTPTRILFSVRALAAGSHRLSATVSSSEQDAHAADDSATLTMEVEAPPVPVPPRQPAAPRPTQRSDRLIGTPGADFLRGLGGADKLVGLGGNDRLDGGPGHDTLIGGPGRDTLLGRTGNDTIEARDRTRDTIACGPGRDRVFADRADTIRNDCERVLRR